MLKIKENVDLKELEKYGLEPVYSCNEKDGKIYIAYLKSSKICNRFGYLFVKPYKKVFCIYVPQRIIENNAKCINIIEENDYIDTDLLYDLIKDGLVEKVDDK